ncbi:MAG: AarF/UbiB family protein [Rickettsiales bacterium]|nr:AarF/UbiB family protein [Rickettsiales bacterium]
MTAVILSIFNILRLLLLLIIAFISFPFLRNRSIFFFLYSAGPSFIKLGQTLATRPDLIGTKLAKILAKFQDKLPPFSKSQVKKALEKEFSKTFYQIFLDFEFNPIASASIAQVHRAILHNKELVAVKILRPNIAKVINRDIITIKILAKFLQIFDKFLAKFLVDISNLLVETSISELDLLKEAANGSKLKEDLKNISGFYVPKIFWKFSSKNILVTEWIEGTALSDQEKLNKINFDRPQVAQNLVISYFNQVYINGFFHGDMHPGNLFLMKNNDIAVVDFGIMGIIDKKTRLAIAQILLGFVNRDYENVAKLHIEAGLVKENVNLESLAISCRKIGETIVDVSVEELSLSKLISALIDLTKEYQMDTKPNLLLLQKTLMLVEGVGVMLDPKLNMWNIARPWVKDWAVKHLGLDARICEATSDILLSFKKILKNFLNKDIYVKS